MKKRILILFGGYSSEHDVSLQSARAVLEHLDNRKYQLLPVTVSREGRWTFQGRPCTLRLDRGAASLLLLDGSGETLAFDAAQVKYLLLFKEVFHS